MSLDTRPSTLAARSSRIRSCFVNETCGPSSNRNPRPVSKLAVWPPGYVVGIVEDRRPALVGQSRGRPHARPCRCRGSRIGSCCHVGLPVRAVATAPWHVIGCRRICDYPVRRYRWSRHTTACRHRGSSERACPSLADASVPSRVPLLWRAARATSSSTWASARCARASCARTSSTDGAVLPVAGDGLRSLLPGPAAGLRAAGGDLRRVRLLLVVLRQLAGSRPRVRRADEPRARPRPDQPGRRAGQQRRLPAAEFRGGRGPRPRHRAGPERGPRRRSRRASRRCARFFSPRLARGSSDRPVVRPTSSPATTRWPRSRTSTTSWPGWPSCWRPTACITIEVPHLLRAARGRTSSTRSITSTSRTSRWHARRILDRPRSGGRRRRRAADPRRLAPGPRSPRRRRGESAERVARAHRAASGHAGLEDVTTYASFGARVASLKRAMLHSSSIGGSARQVGRRLRRAGQGEHVPELLRDRAGPAALHGRSQPVQAGPVHARDAHPDPSTRSGSRRCGRTSSGSCPGTWSSEIAAQLAYVADWGGRLFVAIPAPQVLEPDAGRRQRAVDGRPTVKVVLFCGGQGLRLRDYAETVPKPMVPIGPRPVLWHVMRYYAHFGYKDFVLCLGYKADVDQGVFPALQRGAVQRLRPVRRRSLGGADANRHPGLADHVRRYRTAGVGRRAAHGGAAPPRGRGDVPRELRRRPDRCADGSSSWRTFRARGRSPASCPCGRDTPSTSSKARRWPRRVGHPQRRRIPTSGSTAGTSSFDRRSSTTCSPARSWSSDRSSGSSRRDQLITYRHEGFWAPMDTLKDMQTLEALYERGDPPWALWRPVREPA